MSLGAELSVDYNERTSITSYRVMFVALMSTLIIIIGFVVFFVPSEKYSRGLMNPETYPKFAMFCGFLIILSIIVSALGTRKVIPLLPKAAENQIKFNLKTFFKEVAMMFRMKSYRTIILYTMVLYIGIGVGTVFTTYFMEYYFQFTETQMALLPIASGIGGILALFLASILGEKFDKKRAVLYSTIAFSILFSLPYNLRLLGMFPENGEASLILIYFVCILFAYMFLWIVLSIVGSMMADVVDEFELKTNNRNEGLFFSSMSFAYKCTVGLGYFIAGVLLEIIAFPKQVGVEDVPMKAIEGLGFIGGPVLMSTYLIAIIFLIAYPINKKRYNEIRVALKNKK
jgi:Na+/melibiose symporter-like transporter